MNIYFDMEFEGLYKEAKVISIGCINEFDEVFYAESTDYDKAKASSKEFLAKEVIPSLRYFNDDEVIIEKKGRNVSMNGSIEDIREQLLEWISPYANIQFVADVCHYDFVLLIDILSGHALHLPKSVSASCHDININIATYFNETLAEAFNESREKLVEEYFDIGIDRRCKALNIQVSKHNALYDALICKLLYDKIAV